GLLEVAGDGPLGVGVAVEHGEQPDQRPLVDAVAAGRVAGVVQRDADPHGLDRATVDLGVERAVRALGPGRSGGNQRAANGYERGGERPGAGWTAHTG